MSEQRKRRQNTGLRNRSGSGENLHRGSSSNSGRSKNMNHGHGKGGHGHGSGYHRQNSDDRVRKIVQEEGRTARNLLSWSVPLETETEGKPASRGKSPQSPNFSSRKARSQSASRTLGTLRHRPMPPRDSTPPMKKGASAFEDGKAGNRLSSRGGASKKSDLRARYWAFLFDNLKRAVDEIYQTCETDESVLECKEVIMMLEQCTKDFKSLIQRLELLEAYENAKEGQRPTSIAWEVRKTSPGKSLSQSGGKEPFSPSASVSRALNFSGPQPTKETTTGNSWADRVKGTVRVPVTTLADVSAEFQASQLTSSAKPDPLTASECANVKDDDGWETVQRGGKTRSKSQLSSSNHANTNQHSGKVKRAQTPPRNMQNALKSISYTDAPLSPGHKEKPPSIRASTPPYRPRTNSRESEKENCPVDSKDRTISPVCSPEAFEPQRLDAEPREVDVNGNASPRESRDDDVAVAEKETDRQKEEEGSFKREEFSSSEDINKLDGAEDADDEEELAKALELDEEEAVLERVRDAAINSAIEEEQSYLKLIEREESSEIMVDETENDADEEPATESELEKTTSSLESSLPQSLDWESMLQEYDDKAKTRSPTAWADEVDDEDSGRTPGRGVHMHEKLSSPSRKRSPTESRKRAEERQAKARDQRERFLQEKGERLRTLTSKVEEVRAWKDELMLQRRVTMEKRLQRAEDKRQLQLKKIVRKAHEEETKANEIAFINSLEAQNKKHDIIVKHQESEARLQDIQEERQRKHEEKAAKEAAVEERRKALEADRQARLLEMQERRLKRETDFEQRQMEKEKERVELARAKERDREERLAAARAQQRAHIEELQKKIQQKQDETERRHRERLEQVREKAFEMSVLKHSTEDHNDAPRLVPYERKKFCTVCKVMIPSEVYLLSHLRGKKHQQSLTESNGGKDLSKQEIETFNLKHILDAPADRSESQVTCDKERQKALKKRCKKLRQRMSQRGTEYESTTAKKQQSVESEHRAKLQKLVKDVNKYAQSEDKGPWPQSKVAALERALGEMGRLLEKQVQVDQVSFRGCGGVTALCRILLVISQSGSQLPAVIPAKTLVHTCSVLRLACLESYDNCFYLLFSNKIGSLIDLLAHQLNVLVPDNLNTILTSSFGGSSPTSALKLPYDPIASNLLRVLASVLSCLARHDPTPIAGGDTGEKGANAADNFLSRANDVVSYIVSVGIADKLAQYFNNIRGSIDNDQQAAELLLHGLDFLTGLVRMLSKRNSNLFEERKGEDQTQLLATFRVTELVGLVSLMYGMLLHSGAPARGDNPPPQLPQHTLDVALLGLKMLNHIAVLDLKLLQNTLGEEGTSLEFRHIASYLVWYCTHCNREELLHEVILCVGYFTVLNHDNQVTIQSGQPPTVLQQLCSLPFQYFSDPRLTAVLFPTLIACCHGSQRNREILEQELSCALLANFIEEKQLEAQQTSLMTPATTASAATTASQKTSQPTESADRMLLAARFPQSKWATAQEYFKSQDL